MAAPNANYELKKSKLFTEFPSICLSSLKNVESRILVSLTLFLPLISVQCFRFYVCVCVCVMCMCVCVCMFLGTAARTQTSFECFALNHVVKVTYLKNKSHAPTISRYNSMCQNFFTVWTFLYSCNMYFCLLFLLVLLLLLYWYQNSVPNNLHCGYAYHNIHSALFMFHHCCAVYWLNYSIYLR